MKLKKSQPVTTTTVATPKPGPNNTLVLKDQVYGLEQENAALKLDLAEQSTLPISERDKTIAVLRTTVSDLEQQIRDCADKEDGIQFSLIREVCPSVGYNNYRSPQECSRGSKAGNTDP